MTPDRQRNLAIAIGSTAVGLLIFLLASGSGDDDPGDKGADWPDDDPDDAPIVVATPTIRINPRGVFVLQDDGGWLHLLNHPLDAPVPVVASDWAAPVAEYFAPTWNLADSFALRIEDASAPAWMLDGLRAALSGMAYSVVSV